MTKYDRKSVKNCIRNLILRKIWLRKNFEIFMKQPITDTDKRYNRADPRPQPYYSVILFSIVWQTFNITFLVKIFFIRIRDKWSFSFLTSSDFPVDVTKICFNNNDLITNYYSDIFIYFFNQTWKNCVLEYLMYCFRFVFEDFSAIIRK